MRDSPAAGATRGRLLQFIRGHTRNLLAYVMHTWFNYGIQRYWFPSFAYNSISKIDSIFVSIYPFANVLF